MGFADGLNHLKKKLGAKAEPPRLTMRVCMLGARGVGKTSVITSMYNSQKEAVSGTNLFLAANGSTRVALDDKLRLLREMFTGFHQENSLVTESGLPGDATESLFQFTYGMNSEKINIDLEIRDYPGEYLRTEAEMVADYIRQADAVIIAIDTPCMMETDSRYHEGKNRPRLVMDFLMDNLSSESEKLVLFVPLKCEKYFKEGQIDLVTKRICSDYEPLITHLKGQKNDATGKKNVCCAITPIQTLGTVVFDSFERDSSGAIREIATKEGQPLPAKINYRYIASNAQYMPQYCDQPLYYLLAFVSKQYQKAQSQQTKAGLWGKLQEILRMIPNVDAFLIEIASLGQSRLDDVQGYKVLFGRGRI